jgi:membrane-bound PQQ-dependent dehydrogenase (glucose/quinate/shikimate family)
MQRILAYFLVLFGLGQAVAGGWLAWFGGSFYYLVAAAVLVALGFLLLQGNPRARTVAHLLLIGTFVWAWWETNGAPWGMIARLGWVLIIWALVLLAMRPNVARKSVRVLAGVVVIGVVAFMLWPQAAPHYAPAPSGAPTDARDKDWPVFGRTAHATRFSPLTQITPANVGKLDVAWVYHTKDPYASGDVGHEFTFEVTPLKVDKTLYLCTPHDIVIALDAETGAERWRFDPHIQSAAAFMRACRGVSYFKATVPTADCAERILVGTLDARMFAVDAQTGTPCKSFGADGQISVLNGLGDVQPGFVYITSPPMIVGAVAIVGGWVTDDFSVGEPSGVIRAYDAITGKFAWAWDIGRPGDPTEPQNGQTFTRGTPNAWAPMSADPELGLVYVPMGNATPDYWGAHRTPLLEKYASSIVALDAATGALRWSFQTVHHDIWDFDLPANPVLFDLKRSDGQSIPALAQVTKAGEIFVLDRRTGTPAIPVTEKPAPQDGAAAGEWLSPTQPASDVPSLRGPPLTEASMWGLTPFDQIACRIQFRRSRYVGTYTPQSVDGTISYPGPFGAIDWGAVTIDEDHGLLIANSSWIPFATRLLPREATDAIVKPALEAGLDVAAATGIEPQFGTPFGWIVLPMLSPLKIPCNAPPWGRLTAIDLAANKIAWQVTLGTARDSGPFGLKVGLPLKTGTPSMGGPTATRGGVTFIAGTLDNYLRAFDTQTGQELWRGRLPAGGQSSPMTYWSDDSNRQFVVVAAGGHSALMTKFGDAIVAFALPAH